MQTHALVSSSRLFLSDLVLETQSLPKCGVVSPSNPAAFIVFFFLHGDIVKQYLSTTTKKCFSSMSSSWPAGSSWCSWSQWDFDFDIDSEESYTLFPLFLGFLVGGEAVRGNSQKHCVCVGVLTTQKTIICSSHVLTLMQRLYELLISLLALLEEESKAQRD